MRTGEYVTLTEAAQERLRGHFAGLGYRTRFGGRYTRAGDAFLVDLILSGGTVPEAHQAEEMGRECLRLLGPTRWPLRVVVLHVDRARDPGASEEELQHLAKHFPRLVWRNPTARHQARRRLEALLARGRR